MMTPTMIGNKISKARRQKNLSQAQLAQQLSISPQAVGKWERGESMPDIITFNRLAEVLGVDLNYFSENFHMETTDTIYGDSTAESTKLPKEESKRSLNWDMSQGNWVDADFSGLKNLHDKFSSSNMQKCLFIGSEMSGLLLKNNNVDNCDFSESDLSNSCIRSSNLENSSYKGCSLREAEFTTSQIKGCDFTGTDLTGAVLKSCHFTKNRMEAALLYKTIFCSTHFDNIVLEGSLTDCSFENCGFTKMIFQNVTFTNTFFKNNTLRRIKFVDCKADKLTYAFLKSGKADMTNIRLITP